MEDFIGILVAIGFIVFKIWSGTKQSTEEAFPTTTAEEEPFNPEEAEWMEEAPMSTQPVQTEETSRRFNSLNELLASLKQTPRSEETEHVSPKKSETTKPVPIRQSTSRQTNAIGHQLHSAQGARRAFIYSEIFKKKYE